MIRYAVAADLLLDHGHDDAAHLLLALSAVRVVYRCDSGDGAGCGAEREPTGWCQRCGGTGARLVAVVDTVG